MLCFLWFMFRLTDGYSGSDLTSLAKDAALGPIRGWLIVLLIAIADVARDVERHTKSKADDLGCAFESRPRQNIFLKININGIIQAFNLTVCHQKSPSITLNT